MLSKFIPVYDYIFWGAYGSHLPKDQELRYHILFYFKGTLKGRHIRAPIPKTRLKNFDGSVIGWSMVCYMVCYTPYSRLRLRWCVTKVWCKTKSPYPLASDSHPSLIWFILIIWTTYSWHVWLGVDNLLSCGTSGDLCQITVWQATWANLRSSGPGFIHSFIYFTMKKMICI